MRRFFVTWTLGPNETPPLGPSPGWPSAKIRYTPSGPGPNYNTPHGSQPRMSHSPPPAELEHAHPSSTVQSLLLHDNVPVSQNPSDATCYGHSVHVRINSTQLLTPLSMVIFLGTLVPPALQQASLCHRYSCLTVYRRWIMATNHHWPEAKPG